MKNCRKVSIFILLMNGLLCYTPVRAQVILKNDINPPYIGRHLYYLRDSTNALSLQEVLKKTFKPCDRPVPNFGLSASTYWFRFAIQNETDNRNLVLEIENPSISNIQLYASHSQETDHQYSGEMVPMSAREIKEVNPTFTLKVPTGETRTFYLKISSKKILNIPILVGSVQAIAKGLEQNHIIFGIYTGIMLIMFLYNLFIYFTIKDSDYLYYIFFLVSIFLGQASIYGFTFKFLWPENPFLILQSTNIFYCLSGITSLLFVDKFLKVKIYYNKFYYILNVILLVYLVCMAISLTGYLRLSREVIHINTLVGSLIIICLGILVQRKGSRVAKFFNIAWMFFVLSVIIFILKDMGILPYNEFTHNAILIGSSLEVTLLSLALADKINTYKEEKKLAQLEALRTLKEKEQYVRQENRLLETKVAERTLELEETNAELMRALAGLKAAESQLVHAEKMASLGQLTAGIAHEINNPINAVKANIIPLKRDIRDLFDLFEKYKQVNKENVERKLKKIRAYAKEIEMDVLRKEIPTLISGIEEGAIRTINIVKDLNVFSRVNESSIKKSDIHAGIDSTLSLIKNIIPNHITIEKQYGQIPLIECYPGKINQVFMNLLTNSIQALKAEKNKKDKRISIVTKNGDENVSVLISDNGPGIPKDILHKIFDPFFTTKGVGKGTGLGLSIVYSIINKHGGTIKAYSEEGRGVEFIITLPKVHPGILGG